MLDLLILFRRLLGLCPALFLLTLAEAETQSQAGLVDGGPEKGAYTLFHPTPRDLMRELSTDRPDKTESPYTVDAGHFQLEMDFANFIATDIDGVRAQAFNIAPINLKLGLLNQVDLQFVFDSYLHLRTHDRAAKPKQTTQSGIGDFATRLKINLWGDDGGETAFALLPFVNFPTNTDGLGKNAVEGGLLLPLAIKLPAGFDLGTEAGFGFFRNGFDSDYHAEFVQSVTVGRDIVGKLGGYVEFFSNLSTEPHSGWVATVDAGIVYLLTENIQLDGGCNFGVTRAADDFNPFTGVTIRF
jgi:hypothetical protein